MGIVIASLLMVAIALTGFLLISQGVMNAVDLTTVSGKETHKVIMERASTSIDVASAAYVSGESEMMVLNDGKTSISDFNKWDVFIHYKEPSNAMHYEWLPYDSSYPPGNDQWAHNGIFLNQSGTTPEQYEPGILNPGEYLKVRIKVQGTIKSDSWVFLKASTPNGISDNIQYKKQ